MLEMREKLRPPPPKGVGRKKAANDISATHTPTLAEQLSFLHSPRPFKNPSYTKNLNRRTKNLKTVLTQERERERAERERKRQQKEEQERAAEVAMDVDTDNNAKKGGGNGGSVLSRLRSGEFLEDDVPTYTSIEAPPSLLPPRHYCDITGLEVYPSLVLPDKLNFHNCHRHHTPIHRQVSGTTTRVSTN
ncbi:hypothetical protein V8B97DRAFT_1914210 [Scleroderma yunnanense]